MPIARLNAALDQVAPALPLRFRFAMAGTAFAVRVEPDGETGCRMMLDIDLGRIPFSAEAPEQRRHKLALLGLPEASFAERAGRLVATAERRLEDVPSHLRLVAAALTLALSLRPEVVLGASTPQPLTRRPERPRQRAWAA